MVRGGNVNRGMKYFVEARGGRNYPQTATLAKPNRGRELEQDPSFSELGEQNPLCWPRAGTKGWDEGTLGVSG